MVIRAIFTGAVFGLVGACSFPLGGANVPAALEAPEPVSQTPLAPLGSDVGAAQTAFEATQILEQTRPNAGISDENDFDAVAERETIQSDAERLAERRSQYQQIAPRALPSRDGQGGVNIVAYALDASNAVGEQIFPRLKLNFLARQERNCAVYASADQAQIDFLTLGGPARDRKGLDPDGDGYACDWDPARYRKVDTQ